LIPDRLEYRAVPGSNARLIHFSFESKIGSTEKRQTTALGISKSKTKDSKYTLTTVSFFYVKFH
jgi:hypothetical protein